MAETFVFFDVAQTLLYKPDVYVRIHEVFSLVNPSITKADVIRNHKLISEVIKFPDKTSREFYDIFNSELMLSLGIEPDTKLLEITFKSCSYLDWQVFDDCSVLYELKADMGVISNWDNSLTEKLKKYFDV